MRGRNADQLDRVAEQARDLSPRVETLAADLTDDDRIHALAARAVEAFGGVDILIHCIGTFAGGLVATAPVADLDRLYQVNVRSPYLLTQALLPSLLGRQGQVVFVNSGAGFQPARAGWGGLRRLQARPPRPSPTACARRSTPRECGWITVFPGRTATPMQEEVHRFEGQPYDPRVSCNLATWPPSPSTLSPCRAPRR